MLTGAVITCRRISGSVFPRRLSAVHLPARLLLPQHSPVELGRSDHSVRPAGSPAEGWIRNLQPGTCCLPPPALPTFYAPFLFYMQVWFLFSFLLVGKDWELCEHHHYATVSLYFTFVWIVHTFESLKINWFSCIYYNEHSLIDWHYHRLYIKMDDMSAPQKWSQRISIPIWRLVTVSFINPASSLLEDGTWTKLKSKKTRQIPFSQKSVVWCY